MMSIDPTWSDVNFSLASVSEVESLWNYIDTTTSEAVADSQSRQQIDASRERSQTQVRAILFKFCIFFLNIFLVSTKEQGQGWAFVNWYPGQPTHKSPPQQRRQIKLDSCEFCGVSMHNTPERRRGPSGPGTLCNRCGLKYARTKRVPTSRQNSYESDSPSSSC